VTSTDGGGRHSLTFGQLVPGRNYATSQGTKVQADDQGCARIELDITGRVELTLSPVA